MSDLIIKNTLIELIRYVRDNLPSSGPASMALKNQLNVAKRLISGGTVENVVIPSTKQVMGMFKERIVARDYSLINENWKETARIACIDCPDDIDSLVSTIRSLWKKWDETKKTKIFDYLNVIVRNS